MIRLINLLKETLLEAKFGDVAVWPHKYKGWAESKGYLKIPSDQIINEYKQEKNG